MKNIAQNLLVLILLCALFACQKPKPKPDPIALASLDNLIPKPQSVTPTGANFELTEKTGIYVDNSSPETNAIANYLATKLKPSTGFNLNIAALSGELPHGSIVISTKTDAVLGDEGYELTITENQLKLVATHAAGLFHGVQTIRQLLPAAVDLSSPRKNVRWTIATATIHDAPQYAWRGMMLDVSRHFFGMDEVKKILDEMSYYKLNVFHWHLSDDQGWRIEIKSWPKLTTYGSTSAVVGGVGGFYTQEQYKEIVKYAQDRYITIVPEIEMPSHCEAAVASYPELSCDGKVHKKLYTGIEVGFSSFCTRKEITYQFMNDVIKELAAITPGKYIHIGGDESHSTKKDDYIYFINKIQPIIKACGKNIMGWDEIAHAKLTEGALAQVWAKATNGKLAIAQGAKLIMSPCKRMYIDMSYDSTCKLGLHWATYLEVDSAYLWNPATYAPGIARENIQGIESALWTETLQAGTELEYMMFPRLIGHAEIGWCGGNDGSTKSWEEYKVRLAHQGPRLKARNINFYPSKLVSWIK